MTAFNIFLVLIVVVCLLLALVIMVQNPKGGGLSSTFGGNVNGDSKLLTGDSPAAPVENVLNQNATPANNTPATSSETAR